MSRFLALLLVAASLTGLVGCGAPATSSTPAFPSLSKAPPILAERVGHWSDGELPGGVTVFDDEYPGVARLDAGLLAALRAAATEAGHDGVELHVNSGWRSAAYQEQLLDRAVAEYGSRSEAARWVATPATSPHVSGDAVDVGDDDATTWLSEHGSRYGLCRIYRNEPWHFELRQEAVDQGCPPAYADPTHDPRMQQ